MNKILVSVPAHETEAFVELMRQRNLKIEILEAHRSRKELIAGLQESAEEIKAIQAGNVTPITAEDFLNDL